MVWMITLLEAVIRFQMYILVPLLPVELKRRGASQTVVGGVFAAYAISLIVTPPLVTKYLFKRCSRHFLTQVGILLLATSFIGYGLEFYLPIQMAPLFVAVSALTRVLEGMGSAISLTSFLALICLLFPGEILKVYKARTLGTAVGITTGLIVSLVSYRLLGYEGSFFTLAALIFAGVFLTYAFPRDDVALSLAPRQQAQLGFWQVFRVRRVWVSLITNAINGSFSRFFEPTLALKLLHDFGYSSQTAFFFVLAYALPYALSGFVFLFLPDHWDKRIFAMLGCLFSVISVALAGPSPALHLPNSPVLIACGLAFGGIAKNFVIATTLADSVTGGTLVFPGKQRQVSDSINAMFVSLMGANSLICPLAAGALANSIGYSRMMDIFLIITLFKTVLYVSSTTYDMRHERKK